MDSFTAAINFVLEQEGGLTNDPNDPGGLTNFGLTRADTPDPATLTRDQAVDIYRAKYWGPSKADQMPTPVALMHFDTAVNQGLGAAAELLQTALGVRVDGNIGPVTLAAVEAANAHELLTEYAWRRAHRYAGTANFSHFGNDWLRRTFMCFAAALSE